MTNRTRCSCGRVMSKYASTCKACFNKRQAELRVQGLAIVATGVCPTCGAALRHNLAITGWYQCSQYGDVGFRADPSKPSCSFQVIVPQV